MTDTGYDPQTDTFRAEVHWNQPDPLLSTLLETVSVATDSEPDELPRLGSALDIEAVEDTFVTSQKDAGVIDGYVRFQYAECQITIYHDGELVVDAPKSGVRSLSAE